MKYETPKADLLLSASNAIMASFEGQTLDLWDMLIGDNA